MKGMSNSTPKQEPAVDNLKEEKSEHRKCKTFVFVKEKECENEERTVVEEVGGRGGGR